LYIYFVNMKSNQEKEKPDTSKTDNIER